MKLYPYNITVKFISPTGYARTGTISREEETFNVSTDVQVSFCKEAKASRPIAQEFRIQHPIFWERAGVKEEVINGSELRGRFCVCPHVGQENIAKFIKLVSKAARVAAVIVGREPNFECDVPVICLPTTIVRKLERCATASIVIQALGAGQGATARELTSPAANAKKERHPLSDTDSDSAEEKTAESPGSPDEIRQKATTATESSSDSEGTLSDEESTEGRLSSSTANYSGPSYADVANSRTHQAGHDLTGKRAPAAAATERLPKVPRHSDSIKPDDEDDEEGSYDDAEEYGAFSDEGTGKSGGTGLISAVTGALTSYLPSYLLGKKKAESELIQLFKKKGAWSPKQKFKGYKDAVTFVRRECVWGCSDILQEVAEWIEKNGADPVRLSVCMELWMCTKSYPKQALFNAIISCIGRLPKKATGIRSLKKMHNCFGPNQKPHVIAGKFFQTMIRSLDRLGKEALKKLLIDEAAIVEFWVVVFWVWGDSGLLTPRKINWDDWGIISQHVGNNFARDHCAKMRELMNTSRVQTISFFLQRNAISLHASIKENKNLSNETDICLEPPVADLLVKLCEDLVEKATWQNPEEWTCIFEVVATQPSKAPFRHSDLIKKIVELSRFQDCGSLTLYPVLEKGSQGTILQKTIWDGLVRGLQSDLLLPHRNTNFYGSLVALLKLPTGSRFLQEEVLFEAVVSRVKKAVQQNSVGFSDKLSLIRSIHDHGVGRKLEDSMIGSLLAEACSAHPCRQILVESSMWACETSGTCEGEPSSFETEAAQWIAASLSSADIVKNLSTIKEVTSKLLQKPEQGALQSLLAEKLRDALIGECTSMAHAAVVLEGFGFGTTNDALALFAESIFAESFEVWKPTSLETLLNLGRNTDRFWSRRLKEESMQKVTCPLRECLGSILGGWLSTYEGGSIDVASLKKALACSVLEIWTAVASMQMPSAKEIQSAVDEWHCHSASIKSSLAAPPHWQYSLADVLRAYNCSDSEFGRLVTMHKLLDCEYDLRSRTFMDCGTTDGTKSDGISLSLLRADASLATSFRTAFWPTLSICEYYLRNKSYIFDGVIRMFLDENVDLPDLKRSVECAIDRTKDLFGADCKFSEVVSTLATCPAEPAGLAEECAALLNSNALGLNKVEIDRFLTAASVSRIQSPLCNFLRCCEQFKFEAARDPKFLRLKTAAARLNSDEEVSVRSICELGRGLLVLLRPDVAWDDAISTDVHAELQLYEGLFNMFGSFGHHSEVWIFAREMKWFDKDGLERFYKEHENVTNVLLGNTSESYYMSVLDALEPTIRVISALGALLTEQRLLHLLDEILKNSDMQQWQTLGTSGSLEQVQSSISLLRRWFCDGVDEIAGLHSILKAVTTTGTYWVSKAGSDLGLDYRIDSHGSTETKKLVGRGLADFIEQVGMIQHEDSGHSAAVEIFLEQHQIVEKALCNFVESSAVGYGLEDFQSFSCPAGGENHTIANDILKRSLVCLAGKNSWVTSVRSRFPISILFWIEELKEIHSWMTPRPNDAIVQRLSAKLMKLNPMAPALLMSDTIRKYLQGGDMEDSPSWFEAASAFVQSVHQDITPSPTQQGRGNGIVMLHTLSSAEATNEAVLTVLQDIYQDRLPHDYEVLDGLASSSGASVDIFLQRAKTFLTGIFTIVNVDELCGKDQERVLDFLSDRENQTLGVRLHCIQKKSSILHSSTFVEGKTWDDSLIASQPTRWQGFITGGERIKGVSILVSSSCGAGKTRFIREQIKQVQSNGDQVEVGCVTVHEGSTADSLAHEILEMFTENGREKALHVKFMCMPTGQFDSSRKWLQSMNLFFYSLLVQGVLCCHSSARSFHLGRQGWTLYVEFPSKKEQQVVESTRNWLRHYIPVLALCGRIITPKKDLSIDFDTRRVCTYLRAYENGTINRTFQKGSAGKRVIFVLDISGSMGLTLGNGHSALSAATDCALQIFDSHLQVNDVVGIILFHSATTTWSPVQTIVDDHQRRTLRNRLDEVRHQCGGGTHMYPALQLAVATAETASNDMETWIVCLTDGETDGTDGTFRPSLQRSSENLHVIMIGVNLQAQYQNQMRLLCNKYQTGASTTKGFFVSSQANLVSLQNAFQTAARSIPVSQTFELDGRVSDTECWRLIRKYAPDSIGNDNMQLLTFWARFLHRRVSVLDANKDFNYNEEYENLGSTLMDIMLFEVARLVGNDLSHDWVNNNYTQLIYDFDNPDAPEFRLLCTSPSRLDPATKQRYETLALPGFFVPTDAQLNDTGVLCQYLSQALDVPVSGGETLDCIKKNRFVLTLDFTIKMLNLHERIASGIPSIIEGETGVSKTALTKMYSILQNLASQLSAEASTKQDLAAIEQELQCLGYQIGEGHCVVSRLDAALRSAAATSRGESTNYSSQLQALIVAKCNQRSAVFTAMPADVSNDTTESTLGCLRWFASTQLEPTFFEINVDASMTDVDVLTLLGPVRRTARKLRGHGRVVVFFDEINTSSVLGLFKEIVVDHSIHGEPLEDNIVAVAACNPARAATYANSKSSRARDLGTCWASGHYQVAALPPSMEQLKWSFGSLTGAQEREFVFRRLDMIGTNVIPPALQLALTNVICTSQQAMRELAESHMDAMNSLDYDSDDEDDMELEIDDVQQRAASVVSLRDIQRVFSLFQFFSQDFESGVSLRASHSRKAMLLAVAVVYYMRLNASGREKFLARLRALPGERQEKEDLQQILDETMNAVVAATIVPSGIAITRGLTENLFMTLVCLLSKTPLMIVGPPGSSKTLSVNMLADNANGEDSPNPLYRKFPRLSLFHYQCSRQSTSREIAAVFEKASQRQEKADASKQRCCVFMDEAGLPEEDRESLKVLHYLLEGHMSMKCSVGFVAITNHILDAAKSNRCAVLLRPEPDAEEMATIATGLLFKKGLDGTQITREVDLGGQVLAADHFAAQLCKCYSGLIHGGVKAKDLETFFGLRDFIFFLKALKSSSSEVTATKMGFSLLSFVGAIERNFNGVTAQLLNVIIAHFLGHFSTLEKEELQARTASLCRGPMDVLAEALQSNKASGNLETRARFKLIIDCTEDDSIMRLLHSMGLLDASKKSLFKLSHMTEDFALEKLRLISGVKFAAGQGNVALLSQTDPVNESFYDLFNQHFRTVVCRDEVSLFANIAVGGVSRRSLVGSDFECIVHTRESQLQELPAPFLNRFEKYRLDVCDVLMAGWSKLGELASVMEHARSQTEILLDPLLQEHGLFGLVNTKRTLDSVFVGMLPRWAVAAKEETMPRFVVDPSDSFLKTISKFLLVVMALEVSAGALEELLDECRSHMPQDQQELLQQLTDMENDSFAQQLQDEIDGLSSKRCDGTMGLSNGSMGVSKLCDGLVGVLCQSVLQMAVTKQAVGCLLSLATPEAVYAKQHVLPREILSEYLARGQSSLKQLVEAELPRLQDSPAKLVLAYTRTDAFNHCIPSLAPKQDLSLLASETVEKAKRLVCENVDELIIERLESLQSEAKLRSSIIAWVQHPHKRAFVLIVDMNETKAVERCNYIRMCAEQHVHGVTNKLFVLLLHYHPSASLRSDCYPALILGGWRHIFLDGVGQIGPELGINQWMRMACNMDAAADVENLALLVDFLDNLLPSTLSHIACQQVFQPGQLAKMSQTEEGLFAVQYEALVALSRRTVGPKTIGQILCQQFALEWRKRTLPRVAQLASQGLLEGTTQLSMGASIQSTFVKSFEAFVMLSFIEMNKDQNLDVLYDKNESPGVEDLFGRILEGIPVIPFAEMLLRHESVHRQRQITNVSNGDARFPFFSLVSSYIDECLEEAEKQMVLNSPMKSSSKSLIHNQDHLFGSAMALVDATVTPEDTPQPASQRSKAFLQAIRLVADGPHEIRSSLFGLYLSQFVQHRTGCAPNRVITEWVEGQVERMGAHCNILAIHCVERHQQIDFMRLVSWASTMQKQLPSVWENIMDGIELEGSHQNLFVDTLFDRFVGFLHEKLPESLDIESEWNGLLSSFLAQISSGLVTPDILQRKETQSCLRVFLFFHVLGQVPGSKKIQHDALQKWYDEEQQAVTVQEKSRPSLEDILMLIGDSRGARDCILRHFFSPAAKTFLPSFQDADLNCLLDLIETGMFSNHDRQVAAALLASACSKGPNTYGQVAIENMASESWSVVNSRLRCQRLDQFSSDGTRRCMPHYIPPWLVSGIQTEAMHDAGLYPAFFSAYNNRFEGELPCVAFDVLLGKTFHQASTLSSLDLLQLLARNVEAEVGCQVDSFGVDASPDQLVGSALGAIAVDAVAICFVAKVAQELGEKASATALSGAEGELGALILEQLMGVPCVRFKEFFFSLIIHHSGEGTLAALLSPGGQLSEYTWCQPFRKGLPSHREGFLSALQAAEAALSQAEENEQAKANSLRLCPRCGAQFEVDSVNCGTFYCGRDAHGVGGAPAIGGQAVNQVYGCDSQFPLDAAGRYRVDQSILKPLQDDVRLRKAEYRDFQSSETTWDTVIGFELPTLLFTAQQAECSLVPAVAIMNDENLSDAQKSHLQILLDGVNFRSELSGLPDLIEFYVWVNDTFRHLITRDQALSTTMSNLMRKEQLLKRFDRVHVAHLLSLWSRVSCQMNKLLKDPHSKVFWNCQEVVFGFRSVEEAPLIALLSEGSCPEDGNDFLFLVVNSIVNKYNRYAERFAELRGQASIAIDAAAIIHPKTILAGSAGSISIDLLPLLSNPEVDALAMIAWDNGAKSFDLGRLDTLLAEANFLKDLPPLISNPTELLREQFLFRDDHQVCGVPQSASGLVFTLPSGILFAREQDFKLARRAQNLLDRFGLTHRDRGIAGPLKVNFQGLDGHQKVSSLLGGLCNLFDLMLSEGHTEFPGMATLLESVYHQESIGPLLKKMGCPEMGSSQLRLLASLQPAQVVELVHYLSYQLAVEGYVYAKFDLCVTDPIKEDHKSMIRRNISALCSSQGAKHAFEAVSSFVDDILGHYKKEICKEALRQPTLIRAFLVDMNALDSDDSILLCFPREITVRNYVSLLQVLRQVKLSLLLRTSPQKSQLGGKREQDDNRFKAREKCWLWDGDTPTAEQRNDVEAVEEDTQGLWFASAGTTEKIRSDMVGDLHGVYDDFGSKDEIQADGLEANLDGMEWQDCASQPDEDMQLEPCLDNTDTSVAEVERNSAVLVQRWWRSQLKKGLQILDSDEDWGDEEEEEFADHEMRSETCADNESAHVADDCMAETTAEVPKEALDEAVARSQAPRPRSPMENADLDDSSAVLTWANQVGLSRTAVGQLVQFGARNSADVNMVARNYELLSKLPLLDQQKMKATCGNQPDELQFWLAEHKLNPGVEEQLRELGVQRIEDVRMIVEECEYLLEEAISKLDLHKLKRAFR